MRAQHLAWLTLLCLTLVACAGVSTTPASPSPTTGGQPEPTPTFTDEGTIVPPTPESELVIWTTPRFSPQGEDEPGSIFLDRLQAFEADHPDLNLSVRVKAERGAGGLISTLESAISAAPSALPDLAVLSPPDLRHAARNDLIFPIDQVFEESLAEGWYDFALAATSFDGRQFGVPLASDTALLAYRSDLFPAPPLTWEDLLVAPEGFLFPAGDERATFTLAQYLSLDGQLQDSEGEVTLESAVLSEIYAFYRSLSSAAVLSPAATQQASADATWDSFRSGRVGSALAPLSAYINERNPESTSGVPIPCRDSGTALSYTWSWVIAADRPGRRPLIRELLSWMTEPSFLGEWTYALGMIPPNSSSLAAWPENSDLVVASQLVTVMRPLPSEEIINIVGPALQSSTTDLLIEGIPPESASARAVNLVRTAE